MPQTYSLIRLALAVAALATLFAPTGRSAEPRRSNVLMVIIDDVAANLNSVDDARGPLRTPALERLAARGTWFANAYNDAPVCAGSRTALLTGVHAARSGVYYNTQAYRRAGTWISKVQSLPASFLRGGYLTAGYGKVSHNRYLEDDIGDYSPGLYKMFDRKTDVTHTDFGLLSLIAPGSTREIPGNSSKNWTWGVLPDDWDRDNPKKLQQDTEEANRTIEFLQRRHEEPFFLACGFWRPHVRWTVPQRYYDRFPLEAITLPAGYLPGDLEDLPKPGRWLASHRREHADVVAGAMWRESIRGYLASMAYVDEQIGRILDALERGPHREDTIVVFLSDNGMHLGEKEHWLKYALWEQTCRVFLSISVPGLPVQRSSVPVSLIDLYPTLLTLCALPPPAHPLDGVDLSAILRGGAAQRGKPVLSTYGPNNHAIRDERYRYIRYQNGDEELYDHQSDRYEWRNLAADPKYAALKRDLAKWLPDSSAPGVKEENMADDSRWTDEPFK
jgi:arylsulfatase A-like enzyme